MTKKVTYIDSGVLIAAARGNQEASAAAFEVLDDPEREFASSDFVRLETLGPTMHGGFADQLRCYLTFFEAVSHWASDLKAVVEDAILECGRTPIHPMDALHVAAAVQIKADELVTTEKVTGGTGITRATRVRVVSIHSGGHAQVPKGEGQG